MRSKVHQNKGVLKLREFNNKERSLCLVIKGLLTSKIIAFWAKQEKWVWDKEIGFYLSEFESKNKGFIKWVKSETGRDNANHEI